MAGEKECMDSRLKFLAIKAASDGVESAVCLSVQKSSKEKQND